MSFEHLVGKPWFMPKFSRPEAEYFLSQSAVGTFVIRPSSTPDCVREDDHQLLTNRGFMFLDEIEAAVERRGGADVTDWRGLELASYDPATLQIKYETPRALVINAADPRGSVLEFCDGERVLLAVTANHNMYASLGGAAFAKVRAAKLAAALAAADSGVAVEFAAGADNGVAASPRRADCAKALGLAATQVVPFLELFGNWLIHGGSLLGENRVAFAAHSAAFVRERVAALRWPHDSDDAMAIDDSVVATVPSGAVARLLASGGADVAAFVAQLSAAEARAVVRGMQAGSSSNSSNEIHVPSAQVRELAVTLCLHAGCHDVRAERADVVRFETQRRRRAVVAAREVPFAGRTWCVDMNDGFIVVRRAERVPSDKAGTKWTVTTAHAATVQGNCLALSQKNDDGEIFHARILCIRRGGQYVGYSIGGDSEVFSTVDALLKRVQPKTKLIAPSTQQPNERQSMRPPQMMGGPGGGMGGGGGGGGMYPQSGGGGMGGGGGGMGGGPPSYPNPHMTPDSRAMSQRGGRPPMMGGQPMGGPQFNPNPNPGFAPPGRPMGGQPMGGQPMGGQPMGGQPNMGGTFRGGPAPMRGGMMPMMPPGRQQGGGGFGGGPPQPGAPQGRGGGPPGGFGAPQPNGRGGPGPMGRGGAPMQGGGRGAPMQSGGGGGQQWGNNNESASGFAPGSVLERSTQIDMSELMFEKEIGAGSFGTVYKGMWKSWTVAIKQLKNAVPEDSDEYQDFVREAELMTRLRPHDNVVRFVGVTKPPNLCIAEGTPVLLADGTQRRIEDVVGLVQRGAVAVAGPRFVADSHAVVSSVAACTFGERKPTRDCVRLTLQDGRELTLTPDHKVLTSDGRWLEAQHVKVGATKLAVAAHSGPLDARTPDEAGFRCAVGPLALSMQTEPERARTLAFARLMGHVVGGGSVSASGAQFCAGIRVDCEAISRDVALFGVAVEWRWSGESSLFVGRLNKCDLQQALLVGVGQKHVLSPFVRAAPLSVQREYLGGEFGANGCAPRLENDSFAHPVLTLHAAARDGVPVLQQYLRDVRDMLRALGMPEGVCVEEPRRTEANEPRWEVRMCVASSIEFANRVGFRYCAQKSLRLGAAASYDGWLARCSEQRKWLAQRTRELHEGGLQHDAARTEAVDELSARQALISPLAVPTRNRKAMSKAINRHKAGLLTDIGAASWFADACVDREARELPTLALKVIDKRDAGAHALYDVSVPAVEAFFAGGVAVHNCIVLEFVARGSLYDLLQSEEVMSGEAMLMILKGICAGMAHLHEENVVHRDLAARNVLLDHNLVPKLGDFGMSRVLQQSEKSQTKSDTGPLKWMSPESIRNREYSRKSDVWAFAVVITEVLTRCSEPYPDLEPIQVATRVAYENLVPPVPPGSSSCIIRVLQACSERDPTFRPEFSEISDWLQWERSAFS